VLSVVTVALNAATEIGRTLASVATQSELPLEHLVVDGGSTDRTLDVVAAAKTACTRVVEIEDSGAYDAMNQSLAHVRGDYVMFLNAGDTFAAADTVEALNAAARRGRSLIVGDHLYAKPGAHLYKKCESPALTLERLLAGQLSLKWLDGIPCHQSTVYRRDALAGGFDLAYQIAADHDALFRILKSGGSFHHLMRPIAIYHAGGFSSQRLSRCQLEWYTIARHHAVDQAGVHAFYAPSVGYRLPDRQTWFACSGLDEIEGPYPHLGIDFSFRWVIAENAELAVFGGEWHGDLLRLKLANPQSEQVLRIEIAGLGLSQRVELPAGAAPKIIELPIHGEPVFPLLVRLGLSRLHEESGRRKLGIMVLDASIVCLPKEKALPPLPRGIAQCTSPGKRRMRRAARLPGDDGPIKLES
jgi:hypothetical protein